ncbi:hypothetical protein BaRGS_00004755, partial [Batillaria attramentaria]
MANVSSVSNSNLSSGIINQTLHVPEGCLVIPLTDFVPWNNPDNIISEQAVHEIDRFVHAVCFPILFLVSVVTNPLNMAVAYKHGLRERINLCIFSLAFLDMAYFINVVCFLGDSMYMLGLGSPGDDVGKSSEFAIRNRLLIFFALNFASDFVTTVIACERCLCVMSPLRSKTMMETKTLAIIIVVGCAILVVGYFPVGMRWSIACIHDAATNITTTRIILSKFYLSNRELVDLLDSVLFGFVLPIVMVTIVSITTVATVDRLFKMAAWRGKASTAASLSPGEIGLTRVLVGTSILFIVCSVPSILKGVLILVIADFSFAGRFRNLYFTYAACEGLATDVITDLCRGLLVGLLSNKMTYRFDFNMTTVSSFSNNKSHNEMINQTVHVPDGCLVLQFTDFVPWNNPDNLMSQESMDAYEKFVHGVCLPILFLVSIVTNPLNMAVAYKHGLGERINLCIFALAFLDMAFFITAFSIYADKLYRMIVGSIGRYGQTTLFFAKNHLLGLVGIKFASDFLTTIIACERCLCVMNPLRSKTIMKTKTMPAIILV